MINAEKILEQKDIIFVVLFLILTVISVPSILISNNSPLEETKTEILVNYVNNAEYDYVVNLKPNEVYQNQTTLYPEDGIIYESIVDSIDFSLKYSFEVDVPAKFSTKYYVNQTLVTESWKYELNRTDERFTEQMDFEVALPSLEKYSLEQKKREVEYETGLFSPYYSVMISPVFEISVDTEFGLVAYMYNPKLDVELKMTGDGRVFSISNLTQQESGYIADERIVWNPNIMIQQFLSYVLVIFACCGLCLALIKYHKRPRTVEDNYLISKNEWNKLQKKNPNLFFEAEKSSMPDESKYNIVTVTTLHELMRLSEVTDNPIMYWGDFETREFFVIDKETKYVFRNECRKKLNQP